MGFTTGCSGEARNDSRLHKILLSCRVRRVLDVGRRVLIIFDCDGVLVDSEPISMRCLHEALNKQGIEVSMAEANRQFVGISAQSMLAHVENQLSVQLAR